MSTGEHHPMGLTQTISVSLPDWFRHQLHLNLGISDNHVAIMACEAVHTHSELWIWNWKTGEQKLVCRPLPGRTIEA